MAAASVLNSSSSLCAIGDQLRRDMAGVPPPILSSVRYNPKMHEFPHDSEDFFQQDFTMEDSSANPPHSNESGSDRPARKRGRKPKSEDDINKKQRGRPRLDPQDETAADRRRTQIRLAQRAYRMRKETTISSLKKRVSELEDTINQMNKSFLEFNDNIIEAGLISPRSDLARQLKLTTERFLELAQNATPDSDHEEEDAIAELTRNLSSSASPPVQQTSNSNGISAENAMSLWDPNMAYQQPYSGQVSSSMNVATSQPSPRTGFQQFFASSAAVASNRTRGPSRNFTFQQFHVQMPDMPEMTEILNSSIERPLMPDTPYTYSFQETTFARRLHRAALERAFRLLTSTSSTSEAEVQKAFRFTFTFSNRSRMVKRFQEILRRKAGEALETWTIPFVNLGGASLHYPRRDEHGNPIYPQNIVDAGKVIGPLPPSMAENYIEFSNMDDLIEHLGFGGTWFDSHDVEEYLKETGLQLNGTSSFVDIDSTTARNLKSLAETISDNSASSGNNTPLLSPEELNSLTESQFKDSMDFSDIDPSLRMDEAKEANPPQYPTQELVRRFPFVPQNTDTNSFLAQLYEQPYMHMQQALAESGKPVDKIGEPTSIPVGGETPYIFDVSKFLDIVVNQAVCLGRAPGFRKTDVNNAVISALQEIY